MLKLAVVEVRVRRVRVRVRVRIVKRVELLTSIIVWIFGKLCEDLFIKRMAW